MSRWKGPVEMYYICGTYICRKKQKPKHDANELQPFSEY